VILIGPELEQSLGAIACCCGFNIDWPVLDQIEYDSRENQVAPKQYVLHDSKRSRISAAVGEYEPETITLTLDRGRCKTFEAIITAAASTGFGKHAYFLDRPSKPPKDVMNAISAAHQLFSSKRPILRSAFVAVDRVNAICRCFLGGTGIRPTPYWVYAANVRTMHAEKLSPDDAKPFSIKGYR